MADVLRSTTFQLEFQGQDGITGIRQFTKAVTDADAATEALSAQLGENVKVTVKNITTQAESVRQAKLVLSQMEKTGAKVAEVTRFYELQSSMIGKTINEQEALNAVHRLGANATQAQKDQITDLVQKYQQLRDSSNLSSLVTELSSSYARQAEMVGKTANEQERLNAVAKLGVNATDAQIDQVNRSVVAYQQLRDAQEQKIQKDNAIAADSARLEKTMGQLNEQYFRQAMLLTKTANEQEILNAVQRLGANANQAQKDQVFTLVQNYQRLRDAADKTTGSFRGVRGMSQQLGWQLQDVAVQAQMGTSAFVILSQQGSQLAAAFGPTGALVGAGIAVVGALAGVASAALSAKTELKELDAAARKIMDVRLTTMVGMKDLLASTADQTVIKQYAELSDKVLSVNTDLENQRTIVERLAKARQAASEAAKETNWRGSFDPEKQAEFNKLTREYNEELAKEATLTSTLNQLKKELDKTDSKSVERNEKKTEAAAKKAAAAAEAAARKAANATLSGLKKQETAFDSLVLSMVKQTNTVEEEYGRRKAIIDDHVKRVGKEDQESAKAYEALEKWKTEKLLEEYSKQTAAYQQREDARRAIEANQDTETGKPGLDMSKENSKFAANMQTLTSQQAQVEKYVALHMRRLDSERKGGVISNELYESSVKKLKDDSLTEQERINALKEGEEVRHNRAMSDLMLATVTAQVQAVSDAAMVMTSITDLMSTGVEDVKAKTAEMNDFQKGMFIINQSIAAAMAFINGVSLGSKLAEAFPLAAPAMIATGTALGAAQAGVIMGTTFAGAFDDGGYIPSGGIGIVSEYGDELVNGQLVKGPAQVTSREDTAAMMGGGTPTILFENKIDGARYTQSRVDQDTIKIVAEQVFADNIDKGVSSVLSNRNSKSTKSLKNNFTTRSKY